MQDFEYVSPTTLDEAVRLMAESGPKAKALAGGTDVIVQLRGGRFQIDRLVDVKNIPEMNELSYSDSGGLTVGAGVPCCLIYENETVIERYPGLVDAAFLIGGIQIQGRATLGGNLCNSSPSGDTIPALMALGGIANIAGPNGSRQVPIEDFCTAPGRNVLQDGELLVNMNFPAPKPNSGAAFLRFIPRNEMDIAIANSAASVELDDAGKVVSARIAVGAVAPTPRMAQAAADGMVGKDANEATIEEAAEAAKAVASPINDMRGTVKQRVHLVGVLTKRALRTAVARAKGDE